MNKVLLGVAAVLVVLLAIPITQVVLDLSQTDSASQESKNDSVQEVKLAKSTNQLEQAPIEKIVSVKRALRLEAKNTVVLRGPVTGQTVGKLMRELNVMSREVPKNQPIYLVLDTPGGSVLDGADLIDYLEALPQKVTTVTLFAASMGFQIAENNPGERLIVRNGILMSHRATFGGLAGQVDGELEVRYKMYKRQIDYLETVDANRMGYTLEGYKALVKDEYWVHGFDAVDARVADAQVLVTCGASMRGEDSITVDTAFGPAEVVFDKCPLIREPVAIRLQQIRPDARNYVYSLLKELFYNKEQFTKDLILTNKFYSIFR